MKNIVNINKKNDDNKFALQINCICGGKYYPIMINDTNTNKVVYRCNKCGKDIVIR